MGSAIEMTTAQLHGTSPDSTFYNWLHAVRQSDTGLPILTVIVFLFSVLSEGVGAGIQRLKARPLFWLRSRQVTAVLHNVISTVARAVQVTLMFLLMVIFMTLNPWLCCAAVAGIAVGHLTFHWISVWDRNGLHGNRRIGRLRAPVYGYRKLAQSDPDVVG